MQNITIELILIAFCLIQLIGFLYIKRNVLKADTKVRVDVKKQLEVFEGYLDDNWKKTRKNFEYKIQGIINQAKIRGKVSEKLSYQAFNLANNATLAVMHLQKSLAVRPAFVPRKKQVENEKIQTDILKTVGGSADYSQFDWLYPVLSDEERELVDNALLNASKYNGDPSKDQ